MNINNYIVSADKNVKWSKVLVRSKLETLGNINGKKIGWIRSDLSVKKSNWFTRLIWSVVAKHFSWMRKHLYGVDLKQSRSLLNQIGNQLPDNSPIQDLYTKALEKFNQIAPRHAIVPMVEKINANRNTSLKSLGLDNKEKILAFVINHGKELTSLNLQGIQNIENADFEKLIKNCPNLNHLFFRYSKIDDKTLSLISSRLPSLQTLDLYGCEITDAGLAHVKEFHSLQTLNLQGCTKITDEGLAHLKGLTSLKSLNLENCWYITDAGLVHLKGLTSLETLNLKSAHCGCHGITDAGLESLKGLISLKTLLLFDCHKITDKGLAHLKGMTSLETLDLWGCKNITDAGLAHLKRLSSLQTLILEHCHNVTGAGLEHLKGMTLLQTLNLHGCHIKNAGLEHLKGLKSLRTLNLTDCFSIDDAGLAHLKGLTSLETLILSKCKITNAGLIHLKRLTSLQTLELQSCFGLTDAGLEHFKVLTSLQALYLWDCKMISYEAIDELKKELPNLKWAQK